MYAIIYTVTRFMRGWRLFVSYFFQATHFLVKWKDYHRQESTWEPEAHIPRHIVDTYFEPPVCGTRLQTAAESFEYAVQQRLSSKNCKTVANIDCDIYRHVFGTDDSKVIFSFDELDKLPICSNWWYKVKPNGKGVRVSLPMRVSRNLFIRPVFIRKGNNFVKMSMPIEKIAIICAIEPFV